VWRDIDNAIKRPAAAALENNASIRGTARAKDENTLGMKHYHKLPNGKFCQCHVCN
jgi:hypothetical protein